MTRKRLSPGTFGLRAEMGPAFFGSAPVVASPTDVLVIGGGPAGLAAAIAVRLKGFDVTIVDGARPPIDKACGEGVLPDGVEALRHLGIPLSNEDGILCRGIRFLERDDSAEAPFGGGYGFAIRRTRLHSRLAARASELGVRLLWGVRVTNLLNLPCCRWVIGADGLNSRVRRAAGLDVPTRQSLRFGFRRHYCLQPWTDFVEVHWGEICQIYVTPVSTEETGVAVLTRNPHLRLDDALTQFPDLQRRLQGAEAKTIERGAVTISRQLPSVVRGRTVLIGDASGSVDAITGDGLSLAFHQAIALAEALWSEDTALYQVEHRHLLRRPALIGNLLLLVDRFPRVRRHVLKALALEPALLAKFVSMHVLARAKRIATTAKLKRVQ